MLHRRVILALPLAALLPASASADAASVLTGAAGLLRRFKGNEAWEGVWNLLGASQAVLLAPRIAGGGLLVAGQRGDGVVLARHGSAWSDPVGLTLTSLSVGFQAGVAEVGLALAILSRRALMRLVRGGISGGGSGGFSLGDLGVSGQASGSGEGIETLAISVSAGGIFAGGGFGGMTLSPSEQINKALYGSTTGRLEEVLNRPGGRVAAARENRELLAEATRRSFGAAAR